MEYKRINDTIILRLDPEEEICDSVLRVAAKEQITAAEITGIGAAKSFSIGAFDPSEKRYYENCFEGSYEITSLLGTLTTKEGAPYLHLHMTAGDRSGMVFGGHLTNAVIGVTAEIVIRTIPGTVERCLNPAIGVYQIIL